MPGFLIEGGSNFRPPAFGENLQTADVQIAIVKERLQLRHQPGQETAILTNAVTTHR